MKLLNRYSIYIIVLLGLVLRIVQINQSLWLDEAISALAAKNFSFYGIVFEFLKGDNHPPLYYLVLRLWGLVFGFSDIALRSLSILAGIATILLTYFFIKKLFNRKVALVASLLLATSPLHIYYSQEIRMYPLLGLWAVGLIYIFTFLKQNSVSKWLWLLFSVGLIVLIATDYTGIFLLPVFWLIGWKEKYSFKKIIGGYIPLGVSLFFWLPILLQQKETAAIQLSTLPGWRELAGGTPKEVVVLWMKFVLGRISFYPKLGYYLLVGMFSLPILFAFYKSVNKKSFWLWTFFLIPLIGSFTFSFIVPSFNYFRFTYVLPAFYGLIALGLLSFKKPIFYFLTGFVILGNITGLAFYYFETSNQREQWKQSITYIESNDPEFVLFEFPEPFAPFYWYTSGKVEGLGGLTGLTSVEARTEEKISQKITPSTFRIMYVSYLRDLTDSEAHIQKTLVNQGFNIVESKSFAGVGEIITYER